MQPKLRFPEFEGYWSLLNIENVADKITDGTHDTPKVFTQGEVPFITAIHIKDGSIEFTNNSYISDEEHKKIYARCNPEYNDILMVNIGAGTGQTALVKCTYEFSLKNVALIKVDRNYNPQYIEQFLRYSKDVYNRQFINGGAQPFYSLSLIKKLPITLPISLMEQTKIADFLSATDKKITLLEQQQQAWQTYKQGMMQKLFSGELRFKDENGQAFPDWEDLLLKDIAEVNPKNSFSELPDAFLYIDLEAVVKGKLYHPICLSKYDAPSRAQRIPNKGDVLFQCVRPYQQNNLYFDIDGAYVASTGYALIRSYKHNTKFIYYSLHTLKFLEEVMNRCTGTSYPAINSTDLQTIRLSIPCLAEQKKIADCLSGLDAKIENITEQLDKMREWKKGLLQQMFV